MMPTQAARLYGLPLDDEAIRRLLAPTHPGEGGRPRYPSQLVRAIAMAAADPEWRAWVERSVETWTKR